MTERQSIPARSEVIVLDYPYITTKGEHIERITLRAPTVRDRLLRSRDPAPEAEANINMMARLSGMTLEDLLLMEIADYLRLEDTFNFLARPITPVSKAK